jgi:hypothetical protein
LNSGKTWKIWKKSKLNSEKIWKIWKKSKLSSEMIGKIQKKRTYIHHHHQDKQLGKGEITQDKQLGQINLK